MKKINSNTAITKVAYALFLFSYMFDNVLFVQKYIGIIRMFAITLMFIKFFIVTKKYKKTTLLIMCLILALNVYVTYICKDPRILMLYLFIFSLKNVDIREFVKFDVKIKILFLLSVCILSGLNLTEVNNLNRGDEIVRYSLGFSHPNIFASYVLSISFELYYLLHNKHNIILSIILLISIFITYYISNTRSSSIIIAILLIFNMLERNKNNEKKYIKKARLAKSLFIFMFILSLTIGFLYDPSIKIYDNINQISSSRLYFMHEYLNRYNINYQILIIILPFITVPYVSRTLGVSGVGIYSYTYSIIYYFMLICLLGINNYGNRVIAKNRDNIDDLSKKFWSVYCIQLIMSIIMLICYLSYVFFFDIQYKEIAIIQCLFLLSSMFDINWFFFGIEDFKVTITRNTVLKLITLILIFVFVKGTNDLWIYTLIMSASTLLSQLLLWPFLLKKTKKVKISLNDIITHIKPCIILFVPVIAVSLYKMMDKIMLGSLSNILEVGYFENAEKILNVPLAIVTALGTVMLPRISNIVSKGKETKTMRKNISKKPD